MIHCYLDTATNLVQNQDPGDLPGFVKCVAVPVMAWGCIMDAIRFIQKTHDEGGLVAVDMDEKERTIFDMHVHNLRTFIAGGE